MRTSTTPEELERLKNEIATTKAVMQKVTFYKNLKAYMPSYIFKTSEDFDRALAVADRQLKNLGYVLREVAEAAGGGDRMAVWVRRKV